MRIAGCLLPLLLAGCGGQEETPKPSTTKTPAPEHLRDPSDGEARVFAQRMERAASGRPEDVNKLIDWEALFHKAIEGLKGTKALRRDFDRHTREGLNNRPNTLAGQITRGVAEGARYRFLRSRNKHGGMEALFRFTFPNGAFNYHGLILTKRPDGTVKVRDVYVYNTGEMMTASLRRSAITIAAKETDGPRATLPEADRAFLDHFVDMQRLAIAASEHRGRDALAIYNALPAVLQTRKMMLVHRLVAASNLGDAEFDAALAAFRKHFPNDPALDLHAVEHHRLRKEYAEALAAIDRVEKQVGGDIELNLERSPFYLALGKPEEARRAVQAVIDRMPDLEQAYWAMLELALVAKDHDRTLELLRLLAQRFAADTRDLPSLPEFAAFVKTPQFKEWKGQ